MSLQQKCLIKKWTQDYHSIFAKTNMEVSKCIYNKTKEDFEKNCPNKRLLLVENEEHQNLELEMSIESEQIPDKSVIFERSLTFRLGDPVSNDDRYKINVAEQLVLDVTNCTVNDFNSYESVFLLPVRNERNLVNYGLMFVLQVKVPVAPDLDVIYGFVMVPYLSFNESIILNESQFKKYMKCIENLSRTGCDLQALMKEACANGMPPVIALNSFWLWLGLMWFVSR